MSAREWRLVTKSNPCPACGKPDWCAWTREGWLKCERSTDAPRGMVAVSLKDGGGLFKPDDASQRNGPVPKRRRHGDGDRTPRKPARGAGSVTVASDATPHTGGRTFPTARGAVAELEGRYGPRSTMWTYHDASGDPVGLVVRWNRPPKESGGAPSKEIHPVSKLAERWANKGMPTPRPLYGLPVLLATPAGSRVYVTEGEKSADAARAVGLVVTTSPHGSKSAAKADWSPVAGHDVVILVDHDAAGERYGAAVAQLCMAAGAKSVRIVRLVELWAGMPEGGDMADLLDHRGGDGDPIRVEIESLADRTEPVVVMPETPEVPAFKPFPVKVLPEPIRAFVAECAKAIGCDASCIALPMLSGLASAIGNTHRIALKRKWTEPAIVWTAIVAESGAKKSPPIEVALEPIRKRQHEAMKEHAEAMKQHADALAIYERDAANWTRAKSDAPPPAKPDSPIAYRCWTDDATTEALAVLLQQNPRGLLMVRDELAGWFNFDRYAGGKGGGDVAKWLEMFGGRPMVVDRKTGGMLYVPSAAVSITGSIQPKTLRRALGEEHRDNGLAARLLFAEPPRKVLRWTEADVDANTEAAVARVFDRLYGLTPETDENGDERPRLVTLAPDGKAAWVTFYNEHAGEQVNLSGDEAAAWSKLEGYAARLALVIHLTRWASGDATLRDPARVDEASIAAGVALARWFGDEARRVYSILSESEEERETRQLVEWIEGKGGTVTVRDLTRGPCPYRNDPERSAKALGDLVASDIGRWEVDTPGPKGGRPTDRFRLLSRSGDAGDGDETPVNAENGAGSVTVAKAIEAGGGWREV